MTAIDFLQIIGRNHKPPGGQVAWHDLIIHHIEGRFLSAGPGQQSHQASRRTRVNVELHDLALPPQIDNLRGVGSITSDHVPAVFPVVEHGLGEPRRLVRIAVGPVQQLHLRDPHRRRKVGGNLHGIAGPGHGRAVRQPLHLGRRRGSQPRVGPPRRADPGRHREEKGRVDAVIPRMRNEARRPGNPFGVELQFIFLPLGDAHDVDLGTVGAVVTTAIGNQVQLAIRHVARPMGTLTNPAIGTPAIHRHDRGIHDEVSSLAGQPELNVFQHDVALADQIEV